MEILTLAAEVGPAKASRKLGVPVGTIHSMRFRARQAERIAPPASAARGTTENDLPKSEAEPKHAEPKETVVTKPRRVARSYTPSQRAQALELIADKGVTAVSQELGISRFALYDWKRKVERAAQGLGDSPTSGPDPADAETKRDNEILAVWREHPGLGPSQIKNQLRRKGVKVSINTARRVMEDAGYRTPKVRRQKHDKRFEAIRPNHIWHLDFVQRYIGKASTFTLIMIDDRSRFVVGHGVDDAERADFVINAFEEATTRHGKPEFVLHDKGSAFWNWRGISRFTRLLEEMNVDQIVAEYKEWNGKVEVFNANLHKELFDVQRFYDVGEMKRRLATHLHWYNHRRTNHALGGLLVPADSYFGRTQEVLARIEAGNTDDPADVLSVRNRVLELFKVTSCGGQPEVWLMGQQILGAQHY